jgi:hypothetical protein
MGHIEQVGEQIQLMPSGQASEVMDRTLYIMRGLGRAAITDRRIVIAFNRHAPVRYFPTKMRI